MNLKRNFRVAVVLVPVLLWDIFYFCLKQVYNVCSQVDEKGGEFIQKWVEGD